MSFRFAYFIAVLCSVYAVAASFAVSAQAHSTGPTELESILIGDRWAAKEVPHLPNHCSNGRLKVTYVPEITFDPDGDGPQPAQRLDSRGVANGWAWNGFDYFWDHAKCDATLISGMPADERCAVRAHELMHFVIGPQHEGPLDPRHPGPVECFTHANESTPKKSKRRAKRTQAQINRSIRYRRTQARIRARAAMKRMHQR